VSSRRRALALVAFLIALLVALTGLTAPANAAGPNEVTVATHDLEPFVMTDDGIKSGFTIELLEAIAKRENWTLDYVDVDNVAEQLQAVRDRRVDAAATAISITADRTEDYDFSQPILNSGLQIMVPTSRLKESTPGLREFLDLVFSKMMVIWLAAGLVISVVPAHIIWFSERKHGHSMVPKTYFRGVFRAFGWSLGMLAGQPDDIPRHSLTRVLATLWAFVGIIFVAFYTATLTANLTVAKFDAQINSPADLLGKRVCTVADTAPARYLNSIGVEARGVGKISDCYDSLKKDDLDAVVFDSPVLRFYVAHEGAGVGHIVGTIFEAEDYGVAFPNKSELRKRFDEGLLSVREDGTYDLIKQKWFGFENANSADGS
jgi:polar amino acid transport system substrate-binding protein